MKDSTRGLQSFAKANTETFDAFKKTGSAVTGAGLALAGGIGSAVKVATDFQYEMSTVASISGATADELEQLSEKAKDMGATTKFSASESAAAFQYMAMAGWDVEEMLGGIEGIMNLAAASGEDLALVSDIVTDSLTAFGMQADESAEFADILAAAASNSNTNVAMMGETFKYAAPVLGSLGYSAEDAAIATGLMANAGIKATQSGTALRTMFTNLANPTDSVAKQMDELGISMTDSEGNMKSMDEVLRDIREGFSGLSEDQKAQAASTLFGKQAMSGALAIINASEEEYNSLAEAVKNSDGSAEEMAETMEDNLQGSLTELKSALEGAAISLGEALAPTIKDVTEYVKQLVDWFNGLDKETKENIAKFTALAAVAALVIGPLLLLVGFIPTIIAGFKALGVVIATITSPIGLVIAAVVALGVVIYKYWDEIKEFTINTWNAIKEFFSELWASIKERVVESWESISEFFVNIWESITETASEAWNGFVDTIMSVVEPIAAKIKEVFDSVKENIENIWEGIRGFFESIWEIIKNVFLGALLLIVNLVTGDFEGLKENASAIWENIKDALSNAWESIKKVFSNALEAVKKIVSQYWDWIKESTSKAFNKIKEILSNIWNGIKNFFTETLTSIWNNIKQKFSDMKNSVKDKVKEVKQTIKNNWNSAVEFLKNIDLMQVGKDIIQGLIDGIGSMARAAKNKAKEIAGGITGGIKNLLKISSPSKVLAEIGRWTGEGLAEGIAKTASIVERSSDVLADAATLEAKDIDMSYITPNGIRGTLSSAVRGTVDVNSRGSALVNAIGSLEKRLSNLEVVMDGREVGRIVEPHVTENQDRKTIIRNSFQQSKGGRW